MDDHVETLRRYNRWRRGQDCEEMQDPRVVGDAIDAACDEIDRLRGAVERLREYAKHRYTCNIGHYNPRTGGDHPCNCGYDELRKELEEST